jgi:hypothetical protein
VRRELKCVVLRLCSCVVRVSLAPHSNTQVGGLNILSTTSSKALRVDEVQWMTCADTAARSGSGVPPVQFFGGCGFLAMRMFFAQCTDACSCTGVLKSSLCSRSVHSGRGRVCVGVSYLCLYHMLWMYVFCPEGSVSMPCQKAPLQVVHCGWWVSPPLNGCLSAILSLHGWMRQ